MSDKTSFMSKSKGKTVVEKVDQNESNGKIVPPSKPAPPALSGEEIKLLANGLIHINYLFTL